jgi:adenylate kinase
MDFRGLTAPPIVVSSLLQSPEAQRLIDAGLMVGDREVTNLLFRRLLDPENATGVLVDGFPRTLVQVECLKLLYNRLMELRREVLEGGAKPIEYPKPVFHIVVLFVSEAESIERQLQRGRRYKEHNEQVKRSGVGEEREIRKTDLSKEAARNRYRTFKTITYESLKSLREVFHYHFINAEGTVDDVQKRIVRELSYQSSLELEESTFDIVSRLPIATSLSVHARQELVQRLDDYAANQPGLLRRVVQTIERQFLPIISRHAISGLAMVNSEDHLFDDPVALTMLVDVFSERGFHATVDVRREYIPTEFDPETGTMTSRLRKVHNFVIRFPGSEIRRGR